MTRYLDVYWDQCSVSLNELFKLISLMCIGMSRSVLLLSLFSYSLLIESKDPKQVKHDVRTFPDDFMFGSATASVQIEGGWDADGKTENVWDRWTHDNPCVTDDCQNADIANDSYHKYKRDVEIIRELGLDVYRFSISWNRILPNGFSDKINEAGVQYYNNLIDELLKYNIKPFVTMFHWDLPQKLQDLGGWASPYSIDWFSDYARVLYEQFGDRVKHWNTINEPFSICFHGYGKGLAAPGVVSEGIGHYMCSKNVLLAHASAYHVYDKNFRASQNGEVGIVVNTFWFESYSEEDIEATELVYQFQFGQYAHPIFSAAGDWPPVMKERVAAKSAAQGFARSRLPEFTPEEIEQLVGTSDFMGLNHYTSSIVQLNQSAVSYYKSPSMEDDYEALVFQPDDWKAAASSWLKDYPPGFYKLLKRIKDDYNNPKIYITENGFSTAPEAGLDDDVRVNYIRGYLDAMLDAMDEGSNVKMYMYWSLMDNFEWARGYTERFGIYAVDYYSPERTRTPRKSAFVYKEIVRSRALDYHYEPDTTAMVIDEGH